MKFSYNWLQKFFDEKLPEPEVLAEKLGIHSFELDGIEKTENGDTLLDLDILPNRSSDSYSYQGIVWEIAANFNLKPKNLIPDFQGDENLDVNDFINLEVQSDKVKRATKRIAVDVEIKESPEWLKNLLESIGQRSINNVVDITNYVMWMTGQPVHAFDFDKLAGGEKKDIFIRPAKNGEKVVDLSGDEHELDETMLVIADSEKALDIAGVKGGAVSGVDENTKRVILSAVNFDFQNIRNTSKKIKLRTDASARYENEVPLCRLDDAVNLFADLIKELVGAKVSHNLIDTNPFNFDEKKIIELPSEKLNSVLGAEVESEKVLEILNSLNIKTKFDGEKYVSEIPCDRLDLNIPADLIEEVGRIIGYDNLPAEMPSEKFNIPEQSKFKKNFYKVLDLLTSLGFYEVQTRALSKKGVIELANPYTSELSFVRDNLLDKLRERVEKEFVNMSEPKLFEVGKIFTGYETGEPDKIVAEHWSFAGMIGRKKIKEKQKEDLFYRTKGYLEKVFEILSVKNIEWKEGQGEILAELWAQGEKIGEVGVNFWEINFERLIQNIDESVNYKVVSKFPKMERDVAFWVPEDFKVAEAEEILKSQNLENLVSMEIFDIYKDKENGRKSFAFKFIFQSNERTLTDEEVNGEMEKIYGILREKGFETR